MRPAYQIDISGAEWTLIESHLPAIRAPGRLRVHPLREISTPSSSWCAAAALALAPA